MWHYRSHFNARPYVNRTHCHLLLFLKIWNHGINNQKTFFFLSCLFAVKGMTMHCKWELPTLPETLPLESYELQKTRAAAPLFDAGALNNHRTVPHGRNKSFFLPDEYDNWASFWEHQPLPSAESWIATLSVRGWVWVFSCTVRCFASWSITSEEGTRDECFCPSIGVSAASGGKHLYRPKNHLGSRLLLSVAVSMHNA